MTDGSPGLRGPVGVIGFGRCGSLASRILSARHDVLATDVADRSAEAAGMGVAWGDLSAAASRPVVLMAVPIRALPAALEAAIPHLAPDALVVDMASVKLRPLAWMAERLPVTVRRVGTHPLFGPDSVGEEGLAGQRIVVCTAPGFESDAALVERAARDLGLVPLRATAEDHDRQMASSQALVFLLARAMARAGIEPAAYGTPSEQRLQSALTLVGRDTQTLYEDILRFNPFAAETAARLAEAMRVELDHLGGAETPYPF